MPTAQITPAAYDRKGDPHSFTVFMRHGGWCWFQDPRAIVHDDKVFMGAVRGNEEGPALVGIYDLKVDRPLGNVTVHPNFGRDDHNAPVFYPRPDGSMMTVYARHHRDGFHFQRFSAPAAPLNWSDELRHARDPDNPQDRVTYMNLYHLLDEGRLYNFFRCIDFNPTFVTSTDHGESWSEPVHFFQNERHRPYARYCSNGRDTIHVSITDGHPRDFGNSIYYFAFKGGRYHRADGSLIKSLSQDGPLRPSEAETIYCGSMTRDKPADCESVPNSAWTSDIAIDRQGHPHIAYSVYLNNDDHRYRLASWNGKRWRDREIAYAGGCLYPRESSYTGLVSLDPIDPSVVFISTDVDPHTGKTTGGKHQIYRSVIDSHDDVQSIRWEAITHGADATNLRPLVLRDGDRRIVLWQRGAYQSFTDYDLDTVGFIEPHKTY